LGSHSDDIKKPEVIVCKSDQHRVGSDMLSAISTKLGKANFTRHKQFTSKLDVTVH